MNLKGVLMLCAALALSVGTAQARMLSLPTLDVNAGETVRVNVTADADFKDIAVLEFNLTYGGKSPSSAPELVINDNPGDFQAPFINGGGGMHHNIQPSRIAMTLTSVNGFDGPGTVFSFPVTIPAGAPGGATYMLQIQGASMKDTLSRRFEVSGRGGMIRVKHTPPPPPGPGITLSNATGPAGGTATISISGSSSLQSVAGVQFNLLYNPALGLSKEDVSFGILINGIRTVNIPSPGTLKVAIASDTTHNGPGEIARVTFRIPANAVGGTEYPIQLDGLVVAGIGGSRHNVTFTNGKITVSGGNPSGRPVIEGGLVSVVPETPMVRGGQIARVNINVNDKIKNISGASFRLLFSSKTPSNAPDLHFVHYTPGTLLPGSSIQVNPQTLGEVKVGIASTQTRSGPGRLISLNFSLPPNVPKNSTYSLEIQDLILSVNGEDYTSASSGGVLTANGRRRGDVAGPGQGDGQINTLDAIELLQILIGLKTGTEEQMAAADANCDNEVTVSDVVKILKRAVGLEAICGEGELPTTPIAQG